MSHTDPISSRLPLIAGALGAALLLAGCGGSGGGSSSSARAASVRLAIAAPSDMASVRDGSVELRGTVRPASATVLVRGRKASGSGGSWTASVALEPGVNVVDVLASDDGARPALTAIRVRRIVEITVPDITGANEADAKQALKDAHLSAQVETDGGGGFFDDLLGRDPQVCSTDPEAGASVDPGTTVVVQMSRHC